MFQSQYAFKHLVEYAVLRCLSVVLRWLPYVAALAVAWVLAFLAHYVFRWRAEEACRRIREVFGDAKTDKEVRRIAWLAMRNLVFSAVDTIRLPDLTAEWIHKHVDCAAFEKVQQATQGKGAILVVPHAGSWDLAAVGSQKLGVPIFTIVARQKNPLTDKFLNQMRGVSGIQTIWRDDNVIRTTVRNLKAGKVLAILTDLRSRTPGINATFLGKPANLVQGLGIFSSMADVPVLPTFCSRVGWTRHRWTTYEPILPDHSADREADAHRITQTVMDIFTKEIMAQPEQYFWYNKRWVLEPLGEVKAESKA